MVSQPDTFSDEAQRASFIIQMTRESGQPGRDQFSCTLPDWDFMLELGRTFGWRPVGTTYLPQRGQQARHKPLKHDYQPGDIRDGKRVEAEDSSLWVAALERARRSSSLPGMLQAHAQGQEPGNKATERSLQLLLQNFIAFARRGPFTIALKRDG